MTRTPLQMTKSETKRLTLNIGIIETATDWRVAVTKRMNGTARVMLARSDADDGAPFEVAATFTTLADAIKATDVAREMVIQARAVKERDRSVGAA